LYRFPDEEDPFEFTPGKYRYPHGIDYLEWGQPCLGTSILSLKVKELDLKIEVEGRYWLWFTPSRRWQDGTWYMQSYRVIDNDELLVIGGNECKWDLRKHGKLNRSIGN
jgi:hypothetical protein